MHKRTPWIAGLTAGIATLSIAALAFACPGQGTQTSDGDKPCAGKQAKDDGKPCDGKQAKDDGKPCDGKQAADGGEAKGEDAFGMMPIEMVSRKVDAKSGLVVFDANSKERFDQGHVPGATWIDYKAMTAEQLPSDKQAEMVFYCAREQCKASHKAANAAAGFGYTNVFVMPAGILGWEAAGKAVEKGDSKS